MTIGGDLWKDVLGHKEFLEKLSKFSLEQRGYLWTPLCAWLSSLCCLRQSPQQVLSPGHSVREPSVTQQLP